MNTNRNSISFKLSPGCKLIVITGFSGAGKSTMGLRLATRLDAGYVDEDKFFVRRELMPKVTYQGKPTSLYDHEKSIDFTRFREAIAKKSIGRKRVVVTGFFLPPKALEEFPIEKYIILDLDEETCIQRRQVSKAELAKSGKFDLEKDTWMVKNYVIPFTRKGIRKIKETLGVPWEVIDGKLPKNEVWKKIKEMV